MTEQLSEQTLFDATVKHFATQRERSVNDSRSEACGYRIDKAGRVLKCAVGIHITDEEYSRSMEGRSVNGLIKFNLLPTRLLPFQVLLAKLQMCHDNATGSLLSQNVLFSLRAIAKRFGLSDTVLGEVNWDDMG